MKKSLITLTFILCGITTCSAQVLGQHTYFNVDLTTGNVWPYAVYTTAATLLNDITRSNIFESSVEYNIRSGKTDGEKMGFKSYKQGELQVKARELFQLIQPSLKIGYVSSIQGNVNWGLYAIGAYRTEQFKVSPIKADNDYSQQRMQRFLAGGSVFVVLGGADKKLHLMLEAGARYNMSIGAKGVLGNKNAFNDGITGHYAIKFTGPALQGIGDIGVYVDVDHFDYLKSNTQKFRKVNIGLLTCLTFGQ